jgi:hypothetical protein
MLEVSHHTTACDGARSSARRLFPTRHICKRRKEIFLALAFEPLLSRFEIRHAHSDFLALSRPAIVFFGHPIPFWVVSCDHWGP